MAKLCPIQRLEFVMTCQYSRMKWELLYALTKIVNHMFHVEQSIRPLWHVFHVEQSAPFCGVA